MSTNAPAESSQANQSLGVLFVLTLLGFCFAVAYLLRRSRFPYLHESGASILIGGIAGCFVTYLSNSKLLLDAFQFDANFLFVVLLPPIIFESGFSLKKRIFFSNLWSILTFAFAGTLITAAVFGLLTYAVTLTGWTTPLSLLECLLWGSIISATDPVTTLAVFKELQVEPDLYSNVFGESVLNDAVAIALFRAVQGFFQRGFSALNLLAASGEFCMIFFGSFVIGALFAGLSALLFKWSELYRYAQLEIAVMMILAYSSYLVSEWLALSGIVAILFAGMFMSHYVSPNLSSSTQELAADLFGTFALLAETFIFASLGLCLFTIHHVYDWLLIGAAIVGCLFSRAVEIFPLSAVINLLRPTHRIPANNQVMLWYAGLRGAIAFSLALSVHTPHGDVIRTSTLIVVLVSVIGLGAGTSPMLRWLGIRTGVDPDGEPDRQSPHVQTFDKLDEKYLKNIFHRSPEKRSGATELEMDELATEAGPEASVP